MSRFLVLVIVLASSLLGVSSGFAQQVEEAASPVGRSAGFAGASVGRESAGDRKAPDPRRDGEDRSGEASRPKDFPEADSRGPDGGSKIDLGGVLSGGASGTPEPSRSDEGPGGLGSWLMSFGGGLLKGGALAIPRMVMGAVRTASDLVTDPVGTLQRGLQAAMDLPSNLLNGVATFARDPGGSLLRAGRAIARDPAAAGEILGEVLVGSALGGGAAWGVRRALAGRALVRAGLPGAARAPPGASRIRTWPRLRSRYNETVSMGTRYAGESRRGVLYVPRSGRKLYRLHVRDGKVVDAYGRPFDTAGLQTAHSRGGRAVFVMDRRGNLYASTHHEPGAFHHSSFLGGRPVAGAGEIGVDRGTLRVLSDQSGHYRPGTAQTQQVLRELERRGVDVSNVQLTSWSTGS